MYTGILHCTQRSLLKENLCLSAMARNFVQYFLDCIERALIGRISELSSLSRCNFVLTVRLGTKVPWWIVVTWFRFTAQILGNKINNFEGGNIIY